jgi:general secretion pathway protein B
VSYILDALKKSERERPPGPVPDLFTVQGPLSPPPRRSARAIVGVALLLAAIVVALAAWYATGRRGEGAAGPPPEAKQQQRAASPVAPVPPRVLAAPTAPVPARIVAQAVVRGPADERPKTSVPPARQSRAAVASPVLPEKVLPAPPTPADLAAPAVPTNPAASAIAASTVSPEPAATVPEQSPPADGRVLGLDELPAPVRAQLPKLLVSGHIWSDEPALRLLSIDDRLLHEGGEAAPGVRLREITATGAIFDFNGWHFRVAGGRP